MKNTLRLTAPPFVPPPESPGHGGGGDTLSVSADHESDSAGQDVLEVERVALKKWLLFLPQKREVLP